MVEQSAIYVKTVRPICGQRLELVFADGSTATADLSALIARRDRYWRLRQERCFRMVRVDEQGVVCWPEGEDVAPESLARYVVAQEINK